MSFNILDAVKGHLTPDLISKASSFLGESESGVGKAISGILPTVLGGLVSKASSGGAGATEIFNAAKESHSSGLLGGLGNFFGDGGGLLEKGMGLVKSLFGDKASGIIDTISGFAGIKSSSASSLLSMAAPVAAGTLGKHAADNNLDAGGLASLLSSQKSSIMNMLPGGLSGLAGMLGLGKAGDVISSVTGSAKEHTAAAHGHVEDMAKKTGGGLKLLLPLLLLALAGFGIWYLSKGCNKKDSEAAGGEHDGHKTEAVTAGGETVKPAAAELPKVTIDSTGLVVYDLGADKEFSLPDGVKFTAAANGFESQLLNFIQNGAIDTVNKSANWFNMFDVQFKTGGNTYTGKAEAQLKNCAAILKAYPAVKIKLGGYTDNTGAADANKRISQQRADRVKADLVKMGAKAEQVVEAVGYGPEHPVCEANDTPECKARNRRVACKVAVK